MANEKLQELKARAQEMAREQWESFRENSIYFQLKAYLVLGYVVIVVATLVLAPPADPDYKIEVGTIPFGATERTYLDIHNYKLGTLNNVVLEVEGEVTEFDGKTKRGPWKRKLRRIAQGDYVKVWPDTLLDREHKPAGNNLRVDRVIVYEEDDPEDLLINGRPVVKGAAED